MICKYDLTFWVCYSSINFLKFILQDNDSTGVLALFSETKLKPAYFELNAIFCTDVSRQLSLFLKGQKFLFKKEHSQKIITLYFANPVL